FPGQCVLAPAAADDQYTHAPPLAVRSTAPLMTEMPHASHDHRHAMLVGRRYHLRIPPGSSRMDHRADTVGGRDIDAVAEREERVGGEHGAAHLELLVGCLEGRDARRVDAAHLPGPDPDGGAAVREHDRVGLD